MVLETVGVLLLVLETAGLLPSWAQETEWLLPIASGDGSGSSLSGSLGCDAVLSQMVLETVGVLLLVLETAGLLPSWAQETEWLLPIASGDGSGSSLSGRGTPHHQPKTEEYQSEGKKTHYKSILGFSRFLGPKEITVSVVAEGVVEAVYPPVLRLQIEEIFRLVSGHGARPPVLSIGEHPGLPLVHPSRAYG
ncbi:UNVERIFIED_CONTAM: hypothetical protein FKN15_036182 [Acipenser sinensis]